MNQLMTSVIVPTHDRVELLREMLLSLKDQTVPMDSFEVIVVIDGGSEQLWSMLQAQDVPYHLRPVRQRQAGPSVARNRGARLASGRILVFLDDDMLPGQSFLAEHLSLHDHNPNAVVLGPYIPPSLNRVAGQGGWNVWEARVLDRHYRAVASGHRPPAGRRLYSGNFSVPRDDFWRVGGFDQSLERGEDVELGFRLEQAGLTYHFSLGAGSVHRGYRGFESWCRSAYLYGQCDALFAAEKGHKTLPEVLGWYHRQRRPARWMINVIAEAPWLDGSIIRLLKAASAGLTRLRLHGLAHYGYSGIYKVNYWKGFIDELGGKAAFKQRVSAWRKARSRNHSTDGGASARPV
ncbi:MAG: glycosyltransferase [Dehalococcoidia bacterium]